MPGRRIAYLVCIVLWTALAAVHAYADKSDPRALTVVRAISGRASLLPGDQRLLIHTPQPIWASRSASLTISDATLDTNRRALNNVDIRAAIPWNGSILAVSADSAFTSLLLISTELKIEQSIRLDVSIQERHDITVALINAPSLPFTLLRIGDIVWSVSMPLTISELDQGVRGAGIGNLGPGQKPFAALITDVGSVAYLTVLDSLLQRTMSPSVPLASEAFITSAAGMVVVTTPIADGNGVQVTIVDPITSVSRYLTQDVPVNLVTPLSINNQVHLAFVTLRSGRHELVLYNIKDANENAVQGIPLPGEYGQPIKVMALSDTIIVVCSGGIVTTTSDGTILSKDAIDTRIDAATASLSRWHNGLLIASNKGSVLLEWRTHPMWWLWKSIDAITTYVVPLILAVALGVVALLLRRQRRFVNAMIDLPAAGIVFLLDANGRLIRTNERGMTLLRVSNNVSMRRQFRSYMLHDGLQPMLEFLTIVTGSRVSLAEKMTVVEGGEQRELVCTSIPLRGTFGRNRGSLVTCVDITEALEKRRLVNWAQLAHDMQTNLSTIRLNAERLDDSDQRNRILFQAGVLIQRVRDLVSVGRSEELNRTIVHSAELCTELRHEFDPALFPHVSFSMKLRGTMMSVDRLKVSRAIRNAVENGIKALRGKEGTVELATWFDRTYVYIKVSDTGVGMEADVLANMMKPYFTTAKDGTGTGIGTMIMQHVVQLHGGSIRVTSEPNVGTQVVFRLPHGMEGPRLRNARWAVEAEA